MRLQTGATSRRSSDRMSAIVSVGIREHCYAFIRIYKLLVVGLKEDVLCRVQQQQKHTTYKCQN